MSQTDTPEDGAASDEGQPWQLEAHKGYVDRGLLRNTVTQANE